MAVAQLAADQMQRATLGAAEGFGATIGQLQRPPQTPCSISLRDAAMGAAALASYDTVGVVKDATG